MSLRTSGDVIKDIRLKKGLSQIQFARMLGYRDRTAISKLESGENHIPLSRTAEVAEKLGVSEKYLNNELETVLYALGVTITYLCSGVLVEDGRTAGRLRFSTEEWERLKEEGDPRPVFDLLCESSGADATVPGQHLFLTTCQRGNSMRASNLKTRLREVMEERDLRQTDVVAAAEKYRKAHSECQAVKLRRNDISQYLSKEIEPKPDKLRLLAGALGLNPDWLWGYNSPKNALEQTLHPLGVSSAAARAAVLYDRADTRDRQIVDTVLGGYST